jgi:hypothetical protein
MDMPETDRPRWRVMSAISSLAQRRGRAVMPTLAIRWVGGRWAESLVRRVSAPNDFFGRHAHVDRSALSKGMRCVACRIPQPRRA